MLSRQSAGPFFLITTTILHNRGVHFSVIPVDLRFLGVFQSYSSAKAHYQATEKKLTPDADREVEKSKPYRQRRIGRSKVDGSREGTANDPEAPRRGRPRIHSIRGSLLGAILRLDRVGIPVLNPEG